VAQDQACTDPDGRLSASLNDVVVGALGAILKPVGDVATQDGEGAVADLIESGEMFGHGFYTLFGGTVCPKRDYDPGYFVAGGYGDWQHAWNRLQ
jgi:hypothetical protein